MSEPQHEVIHSESPAHFDWDVVARWHGLRDGRYYPSPVACFANNNSCEIALVRNPFAHPVTQSDTGPVRADIDAGHPAHDGGDPDTHTDRDVDATGGNAPSRAGDGDGSCGADYVRAHHRDAGGEQDVLLGGRAALTNAASDVSPVRDAGPGNALREGRMSHEH